MDLTSWINREFKCLQNVDWNSIPDSLYKEYERKMFWVKVRQNLLLWFTFLGPWIIVTPPYLLISHWANYYYVYPDSSYVVRFKSLWQFLNQPEFFYALIALALFLGFNYLGMCLSFLNAILWEGYVERIEKRFPRKND